MACSGLDLTGSKASQNRELHAPHIPSAPLSQGAGPYNRDHLHMAIVGLSIKVSSRAKPGKAVLHGDLLCAYRAAAYGTQASSEPGF